MLTRLTTYMCLQMEGRDNSVLDGLTSYVYLHIGGRENNILNSRAMDVCP